MDDDADLTKLGSHLDALRTERDAALSRLERLELEQEERARLLTEEQDRFVSHLIEAHDRELGKVRLELEDARAAAARLAGKMERQRGAAASTEEQLTRTRAEVVRAREQRELARAELRRVAELLASSEATAASFKADLELARSMLDDAMKGAAFHSIPPPRATHEPPHGLRESGIVGRPLGGRRRSTPPPLRTDSPLAVGASAARRSNSPPPSR